MKWSAGSFILILILLIIFSACVKKEAIKSVTDEEQLRARVVAYWNHKIEQEFDKSYEYEYPLYRKATSMVNYIRVFNIGKASWTRATVDRIDVQGDNATVDMKVGINIMVSSSNKLEPEVFIKEKWVKVDNGIWYHVPSKFRERQGAQ